MIGKSLLGLEGVDKSTIRTILDETCVMRNHIDNNEKNLKVLQGKSIITLFYENSTRTRTSFEDAGKYLGACFVNMAVSNSSVAKGESLVDTGITIDRMGTDLIIMRHSVSGACKMLDESVNAKVINAGDGMHEHPTQALLDMATMEEIFGSLEGLKVAIIGDIKHSRVARSNIYGLLTMGAEVTLCAPRTLLPIGIEDMGVRVCSSVEEAITGVDVVMGLRIQLERQKKSLFPSIAEYNKYYGINDKRMKLANDGAVFMHPGPVNRGVEVSSSILDSKLSFVNRQVTNGLAVRMALLKLMLGE